MSKTNVVDIFNGNDWIVLPSEIGMDIIPFEEPKVEPTKKKRGRPFKNDVEEVTIKTKTTIGRPTKDSTPAETITVKRRRVEYIGDQVKSKDVIVEPQKVTFRSKFEESIADEYGLHSKYETKTLPYQIPATNHTYLPDFEIAPNVFLEVKGQLLLEDRKKMIQVKQQHPEVTIIFVFQAPKNKITKGGKSNYIDWATKHGFRWCDMKGLDAILEEYTNEN